MFDNLIAGMHVGRILPEIVLVGVVLLAILTDVISPRGKSTGPVRLVSLAGLIGVLVATILKKDDFGQAFGGMVMIDGFTFFFRVVLTFITFIIIYVSEKYIGLAKIRIAEYYLMLLLALFGMMLMVMANDLLILFLGIETMSICLYTLVGMSRHKASSNEGALKYFLLGAFTTGFFVYGIALIYGSTGSTNLTDIMVYFRTVNTAMPVIAWAGVGLILIAFAFKTSLVPFHWWSPDAYEGAPTTITAFMSTAPKAAAFAAFIRVFYVGFGDLSSGLEPVLWWIAVLTMTVGNLIALRQDSVKRMLAFSSITHAGYLVVALLTWEQMGASAILFYLVVYAIMNIGAFLVAIAVNRDESDEKGYSYEDYRGLGFRKPILAFAMMIFMLSLTGIPPTAGFFGKYYIFSAAVKSGFVGLAVIGVLNSAVSVYYYLRVIIMMYLKERDEEKEAPIFWAGEMVSIMFICVVLVIVIGIKPDWLLSIAQASVSGLM
ncbi:MAG: NADH-quinone oxidoreductase subunit N [Candidatus Electryonea clarkiae]|nr:NADH-quinone oxidoreductase subunit N [Candidatus Electryonea clarkiae]MDP8288064.1 NADH-quinone oxidoreductase subunit N [Candidatus Electryonea clarkiae]